MFKEISQSLPLHICELTIISMGYNLYLTKQLLSLRQLRNVAMGPGGKRFLVS